MKRQRRWLLGFLFTVLSLVLIGVMGIAWLGFASLPQRDVSLPLAGLTHPVRIEFDDWGIPRIQGQTRSDVFQALGFVTAQDRLFQMDLLRRSSAGRLAEIFGPELLPLDRRNRTLGYEKLSREILANLPEGQRAVLQAYSRGVNQALAGLRVLPFEFLLLNYRPEPWREEDSLLIILGLHAMLTGLGDQERTVTVMEAVLPPAAVAFFTPDTDPFSLRLPPQKNDSSVLEPIPVAALKSQLTANTAPKDPANIVSVPFLGAGSNGWVVAPGKMYHGRALLANDMHLKLGVPNIWYRAEWRYGSQSFSGLTLPGVPLPISGSNGQVAWGFTNIQGDFSDLILLQGSTAVPDTYWTPQGLRPFGKRWEIIQVKGAAAESLLVRTTQWGPVLPEKLLGQEVAIRWTVLDPVTTDLGLLNLDQAATVPAALAAFNRAGGVPLNVLVADGEGNIGWSLMGKLPLRRGFSGRVSRSWAQEGIGWQGYVAPEKLPRLLNPPTGYIVSANQRMVEKDFPHVIGHDYVNGYRAYRISQRLQALAQGREKDMLALQLDSRAGFYELYRRVALDTLERSSARQVDAEVVASLRRQLTEWDGQAEVDSVGLAFLVEFRRALATRVLSPFFARCREQDEGFVYAWKKMDVPLLRLLSSKIPELLPYPGIYGSWEELLAAVLVESAHKVMERARNNGLEEPLRWGDVNRVYASHPFSQAVPWLGHFLDMPTSPLAGCDLCVRVATPLGGASERLVVAPGREKDGLLHMPGGQSGHPLSPHYRDQQPAWRAGLPSPLLVGETQRWLRLTPEATE